LTIRGMDDEKNGNGFSLEENSRCGVLGRILDGAWVKILQVTTTGGVADVGGEIDDSPVTLLSFLMMLMHSYSMMSLGNLDSWIKIVENEVRDVVVSKHSAHLAEMERIMKDFQAYVEPYHQIFNEFMKDWVFFTEGKSKSSFDSLFRMSYFLFLSHFRIQQSKRE
jgi:hypothetical protein